jgi:CheY-like chemotaxis protein
MQNKDLKIPVVDDSRTICRTAEVLLGDEGCEVVTAEDGYAALAKRAGVVGFVDKRVMKTKLAKMLSDILDPERQEQHDA